MKGLVMTEKQLKRYSQWLTEQMVHYQRNPQVCRTFHKCLKMLETVLETELVDLSKFQLPEDRS